MYNGWKNYDTWNVALWIANDEVYYTIARQCESYDKFKQFMESIESSCTPDGVEFSSKDIDTEAIDNLLGDL